MNVALGVVAASIVLASVATVGVEAAQRHGQPDREDSVSASSEDPNPTTLDDVLAGIAKRTDWAALTPGLQDRIDAADCDELLAIEAEGLVSFAPGRGKDSAANDYFLFTFDGMGCEADVR